jgi:hypothetical protein
MVRLLYLALFGFALSVPAHAQEATDGVRPTALLQVWGTVWDQDEDPQADPAGYGDPEADPGVSIRRARIGLEGRQGIVDFTISLGTGAAPDVWFEDVPLIGVVDAHGGVTLDAGPGDLRIVAGTQKVPVSRELLISSSELLFQERTVATNHLAPDREAGLVIDYDLDFGGRVVIGAFNGNANILGDDNWGLLTSARLEYAHGDAYRTFRHAREDAWGVGVSALYNDDVSTGEARIGADGLVRVGPITALVEGSYSQLRPTDDTVAPPDVENKTERIGGLLQVSGFVPLPRGGLEIAARGELFDDARHLRDNGDLMLVFGGVSWRDPLPGLDLGLGYVHREELAGRTISNDTVRLWTQVTWPRREQPPTE